MAHAAYNAITVHTPREYVAPRRRIGQSIAVFEHLRQRCVPQEPLLAVDPEDLVNDVFHTALFSHCFAPLAVCRFFPVL